MQYTRHSARIILNTYTLLEMCITICITMAHTDTLIAALDLHINEEMVPDFWCKFTGASFFVPEPCQSERGFRLWPKRPAWGATSKSRKGTSVCRNVHVSISASWFVGELDCRRAGYQRVELSASWFVGELSGYQSYIFNY